ncbi:MAG: DNA-binding response regulator [Gammaproteobacteria bacterium]|nr:MAG: DNA-binding response regulator [Gammaproteobacteria bacterium]
MKFILADDHPLYLSALRTALVNWFTDIEILEADSLDCLERLTQECCSPDLVLLDLMMPGINGFSGLVFLKGIYPDTPIVILSGIQEPKVVLFAKDYGADGYLFKTEKLPAIINTIDSVLKGGKAFPEFSEKAIKLDEKNRDLADKIKTLSPKQFHTLCLLNNGMVNKQIADELNVSVATVKFHISAILNKLEVSSRTQAALMAKRLDIDFLGFDIEQ